MERNWAELPRDLLGRILKELCITSIISVKDVCQPWHSVVREEAELSLLRPVPSPPWLTIPPPRKASVSDEGEGSQNSNKKSDSSMASFFNLTNKKVYFIGDGKEKKGWRPPSVEEAACVGSSHGWLAFIDFRCVIYLTNPFKFKFNFKPDDDNELSSSCTIIPLPSIETLPCILGVERSSSSCIDFTYWHSHDDTIYTAPSNPTYQTFLTKLVMSSAPPPSDDKEECTVMIIFGELNQIAFCKLGDTSWTSLPGRLRIYYDLYYSSKDQRFYAISHVTWSVEAWDLSDSSSPKISTFIELIGGPQVQPSWMTPGEKRLRFQCTTNKMYLMELNGDLLLAVKRIGRATPDGQLFKWRSFYNNYYEDEDEDDIYDYDLQYDSDDDNDDNEEEEDADEVQVRGSNRNLEDIDIDLKTIPYKTFCFDVYKLDWVKKQWVQMKSLGNGDDVLFVGVNNTIAFSACDFPELKDCVKKRWVQLKSLGNDDDVLFVGVNNAIAFSACDFPELKDEPEMNLS